MRASGARIRLISDGDVYGAIAAGSMQSGVDVLELSTDDHLMDAVMRFADLRKRRSSLTAGGMLPKHLEH